VARAAVRAARQAAVRHPAGSSEVREEIERGTPARQIARSWEEPVRRFNTRCANGSCCANASSTTPGRLCNRKVTKC
jgi:hypothetical protein